MAVPTRRAEDAHPAAEAAAPPYPLTPTISPEYRGEEEIQRVRQVQPERKIQPAEEVSAVGENQPVREVSPVVFPAQSPAMLCLSVDEENVGAIAPSVVTRGECHDDLNHEIFIAVQTLPEKIDLPRPPVEADETEEMLEPEAPAPVEVAPPMQAVAEANVPALKETMPAVPTAHVVTDPEVAPPPPAIVVIAPPAPLPQQVLTLPMSEPLAEGNSGPTATLSLAESLSRLGQQATW